MYKYNQFFILYNLHFLKIFAFFLIIKQSDLSDKKSFRKKLTVMSENYHI